MRSKSVRRCLIVRHKSISRFISRSLFLVVLTACSTHVERLGTVDQDHCSQILRVEDNIDSRNVSVEVSLGCMSFAIQKLQQQADAFGVRIDTETLRVSGWSSNRWTSYIWWSVDLKADSPMLPEGYPDRTVLTKMVQKPRSGVCF